MLDIFSLPKYPIDKYQTKRKRNPYSGAPVYTLQDAVKVTYGTVDTIQSTYATLQNMYVYKHILYKMYTATIQRNHTKITNIQYFIKLKPPDTSSLTAALNQRAQTNKQQLHYTHKKFKQHNK